ncbi:MAG: zinc transporter ZupT [Cyanobacteriota bacterium]|nr:zinc transporter ZupT [Cyanobacteriota bacterium]
MPNPIASGNSEWALGLTLLAGLSTGIGSLIGLGSSRNNRTFLTLSLGFSAGAMVFVSMVEILPKARQVLTPLLGQRGGYGAALLAFFAGMAAMALVDGWLPVHDPSEAIGQLSPAGGGKPADPSTQSPEPAHRRRLLRMGLFTALAIGIHNFPEGLATFLGALSNPRLGVSIAVAIAIHNIPEGLAVSAPVYYATHSRRTAFWVSFLSGLAEPVGGLLGYLLFRSFPNPLVFGLVFAGVAGVMVYVSLDELLPAARDYGDHHLAISSLMMGMAVMALSLVLLV